MAYPATEAAFAPFFIAVEKGYFAEVGLETELTLSGGGAATAALISGELHYSGSPASALNAALIGAPLQVIYTTSEHPTSELWSTAPDVRTFADVLGKSIGVTNHGDTTELAVRMALTQRGIDPDAVSYVALGVGGQRLAAIQAGALETVVLLPTDVAEVQESVPQAHRVLDLGEDVQMLMGGVATSKRELTEHRDRTRRFLRAVMKARQYYQAFREDTIQVLAKYSGAPRAANEFSYDMSLSHLADEPSMSVEVQRRDAAVRAVANGLAQYPPVEDIYDYSLVKDAYRELEASGWQPTR
jgi:NitT/TauT family transport system substrate-binding protein